MSGFKTKKLATETLGEYLRSARQAFGMDPEQVRRLTQIPEKFLLALEEGNFERLPADVYVKGFLKSLAAVYRIPSDSLLDQFETERGVHRSLTADPLQPKSGRRWYAPSFSVTPRVLTFAAVIGLALLTAGYLIWQVRSVSAPPALEVIFPESDMVVAERNVLLRGRTESVSRVYVNDQSVPVQESGEFQEVLSLADGSNTLVIRAENRFGKSTSVSRTIVVQPPAPFPAEDPSAAATTTPEQALDPIRLSVSVSGPSVWIKAVADGDTVQDGFVGTGEALELRADRELLLSTGDAAATRIIYNGRDLGVLGKPGEALSSIRFTAE